MAKNRTTSPAAETEVGQPGLTLIKTDFTTPVAFTLPNVESSLEVITAKRKEYELICIDGIDDKAGYEAVKAGMKQMKDDRIAFVKAATEHVITPATQYLSKFKEDLDKIVKEFKEGEDELRSKKDFIDNEKIRIAAEREVEKTRIMQTRVNDISILGARFDGNVYTFLYSELLVITASDIKNFTSEEFAAFYEKVVDAYNNEQLRIAEQNKQNALRQEQQERQQLETQQQAEQLQRDQDLFNIKRTQLRSKELRLLGYVYDEGNEQYAHDTIPLIIPQARVETDNDSVWDEFIFDLENFKVAEEPLVQIEEVQETAPTVQDAPMGFGALNSTYTPETASEPKQVENDEPFNDFDGLIEVTMRFFNQEQLTEVEITPKSVLWVFPDEFAEHVLQGRKIINSGKLQNLNWAIIKVKD